MSEAAARAEEERRSGAAAVEARGDWSRLESPGRIPCIADTLETAFRECLASARMKPSHKTKLAALEGVRRRRR